MAQTPSWLHQSTGGHLPVLCESVWACACACRIIHPCVQMLCMCLCVCVCVCVCAYTRLKDRHVVDAQTDDCACTAMCLHMAHVLVCVRTCVIVCMADGNAHTPICVSHMRLYVCVLPLPLDQGWALQQGSPWSDLPCAHALHSS